jgi:hypothetical protein
MFIGRIKVCDEQDQRLPCNVQFGMTSLGALCNHNGPTFRLLSVSAYQTTATSYVFQLHGKGIWVKAQGSVAEYSWHL